MRMNLRMTLFFIRFFDILFSLFAIILLFPFMLPIMIILKLTGEHDIFYKQKRVGRYGKDFYLYKFATMLRDSPSLPGGLFTYKNDTRILPLGKYLRRTKINELPQLINILIGQMSIIGYRPLVCEGYEKYSDEIKQILYNYKPGLSGIGSIALRNEEEIIKIIQNKEDFYKDTIIPYKGELEKWYVNNIRLIIYFKLIIITIIIVLKPSNDLWKETFQDLPHIPKELEMIYII
jgi:lipopolysaccharide/colanic/teichoic acid biosynthesis glycosyltransferase